MTTLLLWFDDDGPGSFEHERRILKKEGYELNWATTVPEATSRLATEAVAGVLLDQMLPLSAAPTEIDRSVIAVWGGCLLLHWLRGMSLPSAAPFAALDRFTRIVGDVLPLPANQRVPVLVVSAYYDPVVSTAVRAAGALSPSGAIVTPKPVDHRRILEFARHIKGKTP